MMNLPMITKTSNKNLAIADNRLETPLIKRAKLFIVWWPKIHVIASAVVLTTTVPTQSLETRRVFPRFQHGGLRAKVFPFFRDNSRLSYCKANLKKSSC
jgi:hypothetical protein